MRLLLSDSIQGGMPVETTLGACGLVCSECKAFKATRAYDCEAIVTIAKEWSEQYQAEITPETVWCTGCMSAGERKCGHCANGCDIRTCVRSRQLSTCANCADYGCDKLQKFFAFFPGENSPSRIMLEALRLAKANMD